MSQQVASENNDDGSNTTAVEMPPDIQEKQAMQPYFVLKLFISNEVDNNVRELYVKSANKHNSVVNKCIYDDISAEFDAGFDLFVPFEEIIPSKIFTSSLSSPALLKSIWIFLVNDLVFLSVINPVSIIKLIKDDKK